MQTTPAGRWFSSVRDYILKVPAEMKEAVQHNVHAGGTDQMGPKGEFGGIKGVESSEKEY